MRHRNAPSRAAIVMAAALTFVLAGSAVALAEPGDASDHPATDRANHPQRDHAIDRLGDHFRDTVVDHPTDRPTDRPTIRPTDRPTDRPHRDDHRAIWKRCLAAAKSDVEVTDVPPELRKICHSLLWKHRAWKRCLRWAAGHIDVRPDARHELWRLCHRALWNQHHRPQ